MNQYASSLDFTARMYHHQNQISLRFNQQLSQQMQMIRLICEKIVSQQEQLDELLQERDRIRYVCPTCKTDLRREAILCPNCGYIIQANVPKFKTDEANRQYSSALQTLSKSIHARHHDPRNSTRRYPSRKEQLDQLQRMADEMDLPEEQLCKIRKMCNDARNQINACRIDIAIVGTVKAGKSTLINALVGREVAIAVINPETSVLTKYQSTLEKGFLRVTFYNRKEWAEMYRQIQSHPSYHEKFRGLGADQEIEKWIGRPVLFRGALSFHELKAQLKYYTSAGEIPHFFIKEVEAGVPGGQLPRDVRLVDTPGLDDFIKIRSDVAEQYLHSADVILACIKITEINRNSEVQFMSRLLQYKRWEKLFLLATNSDKESPSDVNATVREYTENILRRIMRPKEFQQFCRSGALNKVSPRFIPISAQLYGASLAITGDSFCATDMAPYKRSLRNVGFDTIEEALQNIKTVKELSAIPVLSNSLQNDIFKKLNKEKAIKKSAIYQNFLDEFLLLTGQYIRTLDEKMLILNANEQELQEARREATAVLMKIQEIQQALAQLNQKKEGF